MRPFSDHHGFLWDRIKQTEPEDWSCYERFVEQNLPLMITSEEIRIVGHYADPEAAFFSGRWEKGARIVEAEVDLSQMPYLRGSIRSRVLKLVDFWRSTGAGYIDFAEIKLDGDLRIGDFQSQPDSAAVPTLYSPTELRWENSSFEKSFSISYIAINRPY
jgi:hypothetical protein